MNRESAKHSQGAETESRMLFCFRAAKTLQIPEWRKFAPLDELRRRTGTLTGSRESRQGDCST